MDVAKIAQWFDTGCDYKRGLDILEQYEPDCSELLILKRRETKFNADKLYMLIKELLSKFTETNLQSDSGLNYPDYNFFDLPEPLQKLHIEKGKAYSEAGKLHSQLEENPSLAGGIIELMDINRAAWNEINYYLEHGHVKTYEKSTLLPDLENMTDIELSRFKTNNASNLSKWKRKIKSIPKGKERDDLKRRIEEHEKLQVQVRALLQ
jgi:UDP-galactopyranose mutase